MIEALRHLSVFKPFAFGQKRVDVIGCGATGSKIVMDLAKLGIENIHVWDFDIIEEHNIANQIFGNLDIGKTKVEAIKEVVKNTTGTDITIHNERVDGKQEFGEVVFLLTDTMSSRKEIWSKGLKFKLKTALLIETRMGIDEGRVYSLNPSKLSHIKEWEKTLYSDVEAETSACGASISVGPTAEIVAGLAVWQLIRWFSIEQGNDDVLDNEIIFGIRPSTMFSRKFAL